MLNERSLLHCGPKPSTSPLDSQKSASRCRPSGQHSTAAVLARGRLLCIKRSRGAVAVSATILFRDRRSHRIANIELGVLTGTVLPP